MKSFQWLQREAVLTSASKPPSRHMTSVDERNCRDRPTLDNIGVQLSVVGPVQWKRLIQVENYCQPKSGLSTLEYVSMWSQAKLRYLEGVLRLQHSHYASRNEDSFRITQKKVIFTSGVPTHPNLMNNLSKERHLKLKENIVVIVLLQIN